MKVPQGEVGHYHCLSRVVDRRKVFRDIEKEHFVALMREYEEFCEVRVITYSLMSNHFHILVEVPPRPATLPSPEQVLTKLKRLTAKVDVGEVEQRLRSLREAGDKAGLGAYLESFYRRMWDVSAFMKQLKQRFTQWYNGRRGRKGTLWEERFRSVLIQGDGPALAATAAYVDLNPVRAGLVKDPKDYRWSGYGEALAGKRHARERLRILGNALQDPGNLPAGKVLELYRTQLFNEGTEEREALDEEGHSIRGSLKREDVLRVLRHKGQLPLSAYLRCRARYFCDGVAIGSRTFVERIFRHHRGRFGSRRKDGARLMRGLSGRSLFTLRDLRLRVFG